MIETERLLLREYTPDDFDALYEIVSDPETMAHYPMPFDEPRTRRWIDWNLENYAQFGFGLWAVVLKETGEFIGDCGITIQKIDGEMLPEIGYHIRKKYWRQGFAKEAARAVRDWAFLNTEYDTLYSYMKYTNEGSWRTAMANGMKKVKEYPDPKNTISYAFSITREEWIQAVLSFRKLTDFGRGIMYSILADAYSFDERCAQCWDGNWRETDSFFFDHPEIAEKYGFATCFHEEPIGFISWDPRNRPEYVEIGHNAISTAYKGNGFGKAQLAEALRRIRTYEGLKEIRVHTNSHLIAPKNYESVGFVLYGRKKNQGEAAFSGDDLYYRIQLQERRMDHMNHELKNKGLHLVKADRENFWTLMDLRVAKEQEDFVASNAISLAQAYDTLAHGKFVQAFGIWDGDTPVGFAMIGHNSEEYEEMAEVYRHSYCLWRFMIDRRYQKRGYGRDALKLLLDYVRSFPDGAETLWSTSWEPENKVAAKLYHDFGFTENGETDGDEIVAVYPL